MHYTKLFSFGSMAIVACTLFFAACNKDDISQQAGDDSIVDMQAGSEQTFSDLQPLTEEANSLARSCAGTSSAKFLGPCTSVTLDSSSNPHLLTIDFGTTNCLCNDGRYRRGQIIVAYTGNFNEQGHSRTITFHEFYVNDNQVTGIKTITNMGRNNEGQLYYNINIDGSVATEKGTMSHSGHRVRTWLSGEETETREDDVFSIAGSGSKVKANGKTMTMEIVSPLIRDNSCRWIKSGSVKMSSTDGKERGIDFGNGACDNKATVSGNGKTKEITLR
jgi:hypothetical protein